MVQLSRRTFLAAGAAASALAMRGMHCGDADGEELAQAIAEEKDVHQQILKLAARQEATQRARFAAVRSKAELVALQQSLQESFLRLIGGLPAADGLPRVTTTGRIDGDGYWIEKLVYESFPGYYVSALIYRPTKITKPLPGILSPCGHSPIGKADRDYQIMHANLAKRNYVVLTYDPVGQAERSQFWNPQTHGSRFDLACGEHAVLGTPMYLLGSSLARFRIWDGIRGLDYLASLGEVDAKQLGCVGVSGGGTLTAYISALDPRVVAAAPCCYITTLPRRMANRIQTDPTADPEQDIFGFVEEGIDHAGLLALRAPRPTLLGTATFDFFPIEGARESFAEARHLYEVAGAAERIERVEAAEHHGMTLPLRRAVYGFFDRSLAGRTNPSTDELPIMPRPAAQLFVCASGQVNVTFHSRPLLPMALGQFQRRKPAPRAALVDLLRMDGADAAPNVEEIASGGKKPRAALLLINGNETRDWREETEFLRAMSPSNRIWVVDPCGAGKLKVNLKVGRHDYADPLEGVEENIAYNAFLVGKSLLGMRVADVRAVVARHKKDFAAERIVVCGRADAGLVACFAAAVEPAIASVAVQEMLLSFLPLFSPDGRPINAASILPGMLERFGDLADVLAQIAPRKILVADGVGRLVRDLPGATVVKERFTADSRRLADWLEGL